MPSDTLSSRARAAITRHRRYPSGGEASSTWHRLACVEPTETGTDRHALWVGACNQLATALERAEMHCLAFEPPMTF